MKFTQNALSQGLIIWLQENDYSSEDLHQSGENGDSNLMKVIRIGNLNLDTRTD